MLIQGLGWTCNSCFLPGYIHMCMHMVFTCTCIPVGPQPCVHTPVYCMPLVIELQSNIIQSYSTYPCTGICIVHVHTYMYIHVHYICMYMYMYMYIVYECTLYMSSGVNCLVSTEFTCTCTCKCTCMYTCVHPHGGCSQGIPSLLLIRPSQAPPPSEVPAAGHRLSVREDRSSGG